ncbi:MAG TPA: hypothetical protein VFW47_10160 [Phenylobacterium sp.]|nr:hypothetical protein [Phenylobacterium sp.]
MRWVLLHSPLTGPAVWRAVATEAARLGVDVTVPDLPDLTRITAPFYPALGAAVASQIVGDAPAALIVHSGAGGLAVSVAEAARGGICQVVFVDAILPHPGRSWFSTVGTSMAETLRATIKDGAVPPWDQWFPPGALAGLITDHTMRRTFERELRPTPLAFLDEAAPDRELPQAVGWSYLRLSKAYEAEGAEARRLGRPTLRRDLHHLAAMTHPREVVSSLRNLIRG